MPARSSVPEINPYKPVIAVVDDDPSVLRALGRLIRSNGCVARTFASGPDLLSAVLQLKPDCLIVDLQMPRMSGFALRAELAALGLRVPIIFITAHEDEHARQAALRSGATGFIYKPFSGDILWGNVALALASRPRPENGVHPTAQ